jgi:hypothetical protein
MKQKNEIGKIKTILISNQKIKTNKMAKQKQENETKYMELDVPQEIMVDTAEIIEQNEIEATILGRGDDDTITIGFEYAPEQRENIMEILELIEEFNDDNGEEEEEETE